MSEAKYAIDRPIHCHRRYSDGTRRPLFVCQSCGFLRDDQPMVPGQSPGWTAVKTYRKQSGVRLNEMPFILTYCPDCSHFGQEKISAYVRAEQARGEFHSHAAQSPDGLGDGLIALVGGVFGQIIKLDEAEHS